MASTLIERHMAKFRQAKQKAKEKERRTPVNAGEKAALGVGGGLMAGRAAHRQYLHTAMGEVRRARVARAAGRFATKNPIQESNAPGKWSGTDKPVGEIKPEIVATKKYLGHTFDQVVMRDRDGQAWGGMGVVINPKGTAYIGGHPERAIWANSKRAMLHAPKLYAKLRPEVKAMAGVQGPEAKRVVDRFVDALGYGLGTMKYSQRMQRTVATPEGGIGAKISTAVTRAVGRGTESVMTGIAAPLMRYVFGKAARVIPMGKGGKAPGVYELGKDLLHLKGGTDYFKGRKTWAALGSMKGLKRSGLAGAALAAGAAADYGRRSRKPSSAAS